MYRSPCGQCEVLFNFTEIYLIYNVVLISSVQQSDSVMHAYICILLHILSIVAYYRILNIVPCVTH